MDGATRTMVEEAYHEAVRESAARGGSLLSAHKEGIVAAAMLLSALTGQQDEDAKGAVVALNLRPADG